MLMSGPPRPSAYSAAGTNAVRAHYSGIGQVSPEGAMDW